MTRKKNKEAQAGDAQVGEFLKALVDTLDARAATEKLGITDAEARSLLRQAAEKFPSPHKGHPGTGAGGNRTPLVAFVDGASRNNPGPAGAGAIIKDGSGRVVKKLRKDLGEATNNVAEYEALIMAIEAALTLGCSELAVYADSELVVKQMGGIYKVKNEALKKLHTKAMLLSKRFSVFKVSHVKRDNNKEADKLANEAIDGKGA